MAETELVAKRCCATTFFATGRPFCHKIGRKRDEIGLRRAPPTGPEALAEGRTCCSDLSVEGFFKPGQRKNVISNKRGPDGASGPGGTICSSSLRSAPTPDKASPTRQEGGCRPRREERTFAPWETCMAPHRAAGPWLAGQRQNPSERRIKAVTQGYSSASACSFPTFAAGASWMPSVSAMSWTDSRSSSFTSCRRRR